MSDLQDKLFLKYRELFGLSDFIISNGLISINKEISTMSNLIINNNLTITNNLNANNLQRHRY